MRGAKPRLIFLVNFFVFCSHMHNVQIVTCQKLLGILWALWQ